VGKPLGQLKGFSLRLAMAEGPTVEGLGLLGIRDLLGASEGLSVQQLAIYIPNKDQHGNPIDDTVWVDEALATFSRIGGGASAIKDLLGAWINPETGQLIREQTTLVYTYVIPEKFVNEIAELRALVHEFGLSTNQGEVLVHYGGVTYRVTKYDGDED
jgi:hypothetical protein